MWKKLFGKKDAPQETTQRLYINKGQEVTLLALSRSYAAHKYRGACVVYFHPARLPEVLELPGFVYRNNYSGIVPIDCNEIGLIFGMFRFVPDAENTEW